MGKLLEITDLATYFFTPEGVVKAVDGITYDLNEGESLGLVGESGCGKSVSALSVMGLIATPGRTVAGKVVFNGQDLLELEDEQMRRVRGKDIGMIFQEPMTSLNPVLTIETQLAEPLMLHLKMDKEEARQRAADLLGIVGIPEGLTRLRDYPHQFSGGMRQRVMIAMAISCNPKMLIADEPTTALDVTIQAQILELIQRMNKELGTAVLIITHNLGVVARYADRVNVMYAGKVVEMGTSKDIYGKPSHPYTRGLLSSVPRLDESIKDKLVPIEGLPPDLIGLPKGCSFRPRCTYAVEKCALETPTLMPVSAGHTSACWVADKLFAEERV